MGTGARPTRTWHRREPFTAKALGNPGLTSSTRGPGVTHSCWRVLGSRGADGRTCGADSPPRRRTEPRPTNIYGATELAQEHLLAAWVAAHDTKLSVLRLQNAYGPGQSLTNPYTGVVPFFARLSREKLPSEVYEDGRIVRDLVYIDDVVDALFAAVQQPPAESRCLDIGSGNGITIHQLARKIAAIFDAPEPAVVPKFRDGDIRAASCDVEPASGELQSRRSGRSTTGSAPCSTGLTNSPTCLRPRAIAPHRASRRNTEAAIRGAGRRLFECLAARKLAVGDSSCDQARARPRVICARAWLMVELSQTEHGYR